MHNSSKFANNLKKRGRTDAERHRLACFDRLHMESKTLKQRIYFHHVCDLSARHEVMRNVFSTMAKKSLKLLSDTKHALNSKSPTAVESSRMSLWIENGWKRKLRDVRFPSWLNDWWVHWRFAQCHISIFQTPVTSRCHTMLRCSYWAHGEAVCVGCETSITAI